MLLFRSQLVILICCILCSETYAQSLHRGVLLDSSSGTPVSYARLQTGDGRPTLSDVYGNFVLGTLTSDSVCIDHVAYYTRCVDTETLKKTPLLHLQKKQITPPDSSQHTLRDHHTDSIINRLIERFEQVYETLNGTMKSVAYESYLKILIGGHKANRGIEFSLPNFLWLDHISTAAREELAEIEDKHLAYGMIEMGMERRRVQQNSVTQIEALRTSGIWPPIALQALNEIEPIDFLQPLIRIGTNRYYKNPFFLQNTNDYQYWLSHTSNHLYQINFTPKPERLGLFNAIEGYVSMDTTTLRPFEAYFKPAGVDGLFKFAIRQSFIEIDDLWIKSSSEGMFFFDSFTINQSKLKVHYEEKNEKFGTDTDNVLFSGNYIEIDDATSIFNDNYINSIRPAPLSLGEEEVFDGVVEDWDRLFLNEIVYYIQNRRIRAGHLDLGASFPFNLHEGLRVNVRANTNERLFSRFFTGGFLGYGLGDQKFKYQVWSAISWLRNRRWFTTVSYTDDVRIAGQEASNIGRIEADILGFSAVTLSSNAFVKYNNLSFDNRFLINPNVEIAATVTQTSMDLFDSVYVFQKDGVQFSNFNFLDAQLSIFYAPLTRYFLSNRGIRRASSSRQFIPSFFASYTQSIKLESRGFFAFKKMDVGMSFIYRNPRWGFTTFQTLGGKVFGSAPYFRMYVPRGNAISGSSLLDRIGLMGRFEFEGVFPQSFLADRYISFSLTHELRSPLFRWSFIQPRPGITLKAFYGDLSEPEAHERVAFRIPNRGLWEGGVFARDVIQFLGFGTGIGLFMRFDSYITSGIEDRLNLRLNFSFRL